jgi:hypothetical protein
MIFPANDLLFASHLRYGTHAQTTKQRFYHSFAQQQQHTPKHIASQHTSPQI